jgi:hypothetical protein
MNVSTLPSPPASTPLPPLETDHRRAPVRTGARVVSLGVVGALGVVLGALLGAVLFATRVPAATRPEGQEPAQLATGGSPSIPDLTGAERAERAIAAVLAAAPACTPEIRMAGAPATERGEFIEQAERLATEASVDQGLRSVRWKVIERGGRLFGVLYGERCA